MSEEKTNLELGEGDASDIHFPDFSFLFGRTLGVITFMIAFPALLYSLNASSPKPRNTKKITEDTGMAHQDSNTRLRDRGLINVQI